MRLRSNVRLIVFIAMLAALNAAAQQPGSLHGTVRDQHGDAIPYAHIALTTLQLQTSSNEKGDYHFKSIPPGTYALTVQAMGFSTSIKTVTIGSGESVTLDVVPVELVQELNDVTVHGKTDLVEKIQQPYAITALSTQHFQNRAVDVNQLLNQSMGVHIREQGGMGSRFDFSVNGLSGKQVKFFVDGIPMENLGDAFQLNNVPVNLVKQVEVYKGVVPIDLGGDALGGAVNIVTDKHAAPYVDASYSVRSFGTHRAALSTLYQKDTSGVLVRFNGYFNRSDNNYIMNGMEVYDTLQKRFVKKDIRRLHDDYQSYMAQLDAGIRGEKWADLFLFSATTAGLDQAVQNGIFGNPVGEATVKERNQQYNVRYQKKGFLYQKIDLDLFTQYNVLASTSIDTSSNRYNWEGKITRTEDNSLGELTREKTIFEFDQSIFLYRAGLRYAVDRNHAIKANVTGSTVERQGENTLQRDEPSPFTNPNTLGKRIIGLAFESTWLKEKLSTAAAVKHYAFNMVTKNALIDQAGKTTIEDIKTDQHNIGYLVAARYFIVPALLFKTSYEKAYRLPDPKEILGDGYRITAAPFLQPEISHNVNTGFQYRKTFSKRSLVVEANVFRRDVRNWIFLQAQGMLSQHINIMKVLVRGIECETRYTVNDHLTVSANMTYQDVLNNERYTAGTNPPKANRFYHDRLSNTPYFFGNTMVSYSVNKLPLTNAVLSVYYYATYTHEFYLVYARASQASSKNSIPSQFINHTGITLSFKNNRYNLNVEVNNIFNEHAYDNFKMQKPGRAFSLKARYFIQ